MMMPPPPPIEGAGGDSQSNPSGIRKWLGFLKDAPPLVVPPPPVPAAGGGGDAAAPGGSAISPENHQKWLAAPADQDEVATGGAFRTSPIQIPPKPEGDGDENDDDLEDVKASLVEQLAEEYPLEEGEEEGEEGLQDDSIVVDDIDDVGEGGHDGTGYPKEGMMVEGSSSSSSESSSIANDSAAKGLGRGLFSSFFNSSSAKKPSRPPMSPLPPSPAPNATTTSSSSSSSSSSSPIKAASGRTKAKVPSMNLFIPSLESVQRLMSVSDGTDAFARPAVIRALRECEGDEEAAFTVLSGRNPGLANAGGAVAYDDSHAAVLRRKNAPGNSADMTDAMLGGPVALDDIVFGGGGGGGGGGGMQDEDDDDDGDSQSEAEEESEGEDGSASESEESEAEGEFKGGKGDNLTSRYKIEKEVGRGTFGRVFRCVDRKAKDKASSKVAIKVVHDAGRYYELSLIEAEILRDVNGMGGRGETHCCVLLNFFKLDGHACMVFETLGQSLYDFLKTNEYIPFPLYCVQDFSRQMLEAISFLHSMKLVHTDLKPENVLLVDGAFTVQQVGKRKVRIPKSNAIKLIDFGCATYDDDEHKSDLIATRQYRAPEVILGLPWSYPSDIWSVGCIVAELYCGDQLFETHSNMEHIALIERGIGKWPKSSMLGKSGSVAGKYFDHHGLSLWRTALDAEARRHVRAMKNLEEFVGADKDTGLLSFFRALLTIDPRKRINAEKGLTKSFVRQKKKKKPEQKVGSTRGAAEAAAGGAAADATGAAADGNDS